MTFSTEEVRRKYESLSGPKFGRHVFEIASNRVYLEVFRSTKDESESQQAFEAPVLIRSSFDECKTYAQENLHYMLAHAMLKTPEQINAAQPVLKKALAWQERYPKPY